MEKNSKIFVAGSRGLVGSALVRRLRDAGYASIITRTRTQLDLEDAKAVDVFFETEKPEYVFLAAAKVGGIHANNSQHADFVMKNLAIQMSVIGAAHKYNVTKLLFLGSNCIYPKMAPQPIKEEYLLTGLLEPSNDAYAIAKIAGIKMCQAFHREYGRNFISAMPANLYGIEDNFHPEDSHVLPGLLRRFHEAKESGASEVVCWGTGEPMREFVFSDDLADACIFLMEKYDSPDPINVGAGTDITIKELTEIIAETVGYKGTITWDTSKLNGTPRKLLDISKLHTLGWNPTTDLREGLRKTYAWYTTTPEKRL